MRIGYARCSTDEQSDALQAQVSRLVEAGCEEVIQELVSGGNNERPGVLELIKRIEKGTVAEIYVTRVDRLGRDAGFADALLAMCAETGVKVKALDGGEIESATPGGFLISRVLTTVAEHERRMLSQRIKSQFAAYRKQGRSLRRRVPFGYKQENKSLQPHPENWHKALRVIEELEKHGSFTKVSQRLPQWSPWTPAPTNLQAWFVNPVIRGHLPHLHVKSSGKGWNARWEEVYRDQHPALISEADWRALSIQLQQTTNRFKAKDKDGGQPKHALSGVLKCHSCGHRLSRNTSGGVAWWRCRHRLCNERGGVKEAVVLPLAVRACTEAADVLSQAMSKAIAGNSDEDPRLVLKLRELEEAQRAAVQNPQRRSSQLLVEEIQEEIEALRHQPQTVDPVLLEGFRQTLALPEVWAKFPPEHLRPILHYLLAEVRVGPGAKPMIVVPRPY